MLNIEKLSLLYSTSLNISDRWDRNKQNPKEWEPEDKILSEMYDTIMNSLPEDKAKIFDDLYCRLAHLYGKEGFFEGFEIAYNMYVVPGGKPFGDCPPADVADVLVNYIKNTINE